MKKTILLMTLLSGSLWALSAIQQVPFEISFSDPAERSKWLFQNTDTKLSTTWFIGSNPDYAYGDDYMLYITNDGGVSNRYDTVRASSYTCYAYYQLDTLPEGTYHLEFKYRGYGNPRLNVQVTTNPTSYSYSSVSTSSLLNKWWSTSTSTFTSDGKTQYYISVSFYYGSKEKLSFPPKTGYAVDAIQIYKDETPPACVQMPQSLQLTRSENDAVFSWAGNASEYEVEYFLNDSSLHLRTKVDNVTTTSYTVHSEQVPEGSYSFRVRSICGRDTSGWASIDYQLVYDITKHCMDYLNFQHPDVKAQYGYTYNPGYYTEVVDYGFTSQNSRHTIHHYPRDVDERTEYKLRTFPEGQPAAIRLGNWRVNNEAEDIIYTMEVTKDMAILQLRYALVMQLPGHLPSQQPRFTLEFLDETGKLIDSCGYVDFTASANLEGWHTVKGVGEETDVIWKDWSLIGLNMRDYIGRTVQVRITTKDCSEGKHFGYAYFTMGCSPGTIQGIHCGVKPDQFIVEEGFYYRWYHKYDPERKVLSRDRTFVLADGMDTATYCVDMMNMLDTTCYFTLEASSLAYVPHAAGELTYIPSDCKNYVQLSDKSSTQGIYWDEGGQPVTVKETDGADEIVWDLGIYGTSTERSPKLRIPDSGDTLHVTLHAYMDNRSCEDSMTYELVVPAIGTARTIDTYYFCSGGSITYNGQVYTAETEFADTVVGSNGCDSISIVALRFFRVDTIEYTDTLCSGGTMTWNGQVITGAGDYSAVVKSQLFDCDSVFNILHLFQQPYLSMTMEHQPQAVCPHSGTITVPFSVTAGTAQEYDLLFSDQAKQYGFADLYAQPIAPTDTKLTIPFSDTIRPGVFDASVVFHNLDCDSMTFPVTLTIYYDPDSLITQRWNDFLSVRKHAFDAYGGFTAYQWYRNGQPIAGQTGSQLYVPDGGLDPSSAYAVELTRMSDGMRVRTCPYYPTTEPNTVTISVYPTVVSSQAPAKVQVHTSEPASVRLYNKDGVLWNTWSVPEGASQLTAPSQQGMYLMHLQTQSGEKAVRKIIVL